MIDLTTTDQKKTPFTGKTVEKRNATTGLLLAKWDSITEAAVSENISAAKLRRSIKYSRVINNYYYCF